MILGIGVDIIELKRIAEMDETKLQARILTTVERELLQCKQQSIESLAGRFAAKEAIVKALGTGISKRCSFLDIEIISDNLGAPKVILSEKVKSQFLQDVVVHVSISHCKEYAVATALIESIS